MCRLTMALEIIEIGHPVLREVAASVSIEELKSKEIQTFIDELIDTRTQANGAGIAANQVALAKRIFVVEIRDNPRYPYKPEYPLTVMVNPQVEFLTDERYPSFEGCLSIPNLRGEVSRCPVVKATGLDRHGEKLEFEVRGITAGTFQHELDHLDGILFPDKVEDTRTLCTWNEFSERYEDGFRRTVERVESQYSS